MSRPHVETPWTPIEVKRLRSMHFHGRTFQQIGQALGRTRQAIAGKLFRMARPERDAEYRESHREHIRASKRAWRGRRKMK
jgi:hypothetical protein